MTVLAPHFTDRNSEALRLRAWCRVTSKLARKTCWEAWAGLLFHRSQLTALLSKHAQAQASSAISAAWEAASAGAHGPLMMAVSRGHQSSHDHHRGHPAPHRLSQSGNSKIIREPRAACEETAQPTGVCKSHPCYPCCSPTQWWA